MFSLGLVIVVVILALIFDYINGFMILPRIATSVSTKALSPRNAILIAASLNFMGALSGTAVAATIGKSIVMPELVTPLVIIAALIGAIFWNLFTWYFGIPSSSSHALIGGLTGAVIAGFGAAQVNWQGFIKIFSGLIIAPVVGLVAGSLFMTLLFWMFRRSSPAKTNQGFRKLQILSACMASFAHGSNDAQKSMGIITMVLVGGGFLTTLTFLYGLKYVVRWLWQPELPWEAGRLFVLWEEKYFVLNQSMVLRLTLPLRWLFTVPVLWEHQSVLHMWYLLQSWGSGLPND